MAPGETKIRVGLPMAFTSCFPPRVGGKRRFIPRWPTVARYSSSPRKATMKNLFGVKQHNKNEGPERLRRGDFRMSDSSRLHASKAGILLLVSVLVLFA